MRDYKSQGYSIFHETMADMAWPDVQKASEEGAIILFPTGVIEQHGPHMCTGVDTYLAYVYARILKEKLETKGVKSLITPPFYWGITGYRGTYPGSFTCRPETVKAIYYDILDCLNEWGFEYVFAFTHHQNPIHGKEIMEAMKEGQSNFGIKSYYLIRPGSKHASRFGLTGKEEYVFNVPIPPPDGPPPEFADVHAGKGETGAMLAYLPDLVDPEMAKTLEANKKSFKEIGIWGKLGPEELGEFMGMGYIGDPANFDPELAESIMEERSILTAEAIDSFLKGTFEPPEIK